MRGKTVLAAAVIFCFVNLAAGFRGEAASGIKIPSKIRIGIFFRDIKQHGIDTSVPYISVSAEKGLQIGFLKDGVFKILYEENSPGAVTVRKDSYFIKEGDSLKEFNPENKNIPAVGGIGPYHIKIGDGFTNLKSAKAAADEMKSKGVDAYPVYDDGWQVWTGFYADEKSARQGINEMQNKYLSGENFAVIQPANNRIAVFSAENKPLALFGSDACNFQIRPKKANSPYILKMNNTYYRGDIEVGRRPESDLTVINIVPFEQYLYGVVPVEMEAGSHPEALKAQAVAARTYALNCLGKHGDLGFDLCCTSYCQVYKGYSAEKASTNSAVDATKGKKVMYNGQLAKVFYFSSSGGKTEDVENVWGVPLPYLKSVEDNYENGKSRNYSWQAVYAADEIKNIMIDRKIDLGNILGITINKLSQAGRVTELTVKGTKGERTYTRYGCKTFLSRLCSQWYDISTDADAYAVNSSPEKIRVQLEGKRAVSKEGEKTIGSSSDKVFIIGAGSLKRSIPAVPSAYTFTGSGWGHGVGMSQEGAKGMANAGFTYEQILKHYFIGTEIE